MADTTRIVIAKQIVNWEAERDSQGNIIVYNLPADDGGGDWEVAGVNQKYDLPVASLLKEFAQTGRQDAVELVASTYIAQNTDGATQYTSNPGVEATLRDCIFNRGETGMVETLQIALGVSVDGDFGPHSQSAFNAAMANPVALIQSLAQARKTYELTVIGERSNFEAGLQNRWTNCETFSLSLLTPPASAPVV